MDLGATICRPRTPLCLVCPVAFACEARRLGDPQAFPVKPAKPTRPERSAGVYVLEHDGQVLLERRPASGLLGGMTGFPDAPPAPAAWTPRGQVRHVFTHFGLTLDVFHASATERPAGLWWPVDDLPQAVLPTLFRKVADKVYG